MLPPIAGCGGATAQAGARAPRWKSASIIEPPLRTTTLRSRNWPLSTMPLLLGPPEDEELEVAPFREREQHGVIGRLAPLLEELQGDAALACGFLDRAGELVDRDARGAAGGGEDAPGRKERQGRPVQRGVAVDGGRDRLLRLGIGGRIEHDQVEARPLRLLHGEELEDIGADEAVRAGIKAVELETPAGEQERALVAVDARHLARAAQRRLHRE